MKLTIKNFASAFVMVAMAHTSIAQITQQEVDSKLQNLPFPSFSIQVPAFKDKTYVVTDFGAVGNGLAINTKAINDAIAKCSEEGGGHVVVPAGLFITGQITMKSNVDLHLATGAMIVFSSNIDDYPLVKSGSGYSIEPLINGNNIENVAITGDGSFDGNGQYWRPVKKIKMNESQWKALLAKGGALNEKGDIWSPSQAAADGQSYLSSKKRSELTQADYEKVKPFFRPKMLGLSNSKNVIIEGITLKNSPDFAMNMRGINGMALKNVTVMNEWWAQNGDGLDISACRNVLIYHCTVNSGDDGICMKSSGNKPGEYNLENIVIKDCKVYHAHGGFVVGSNTDGNMRNVFVNNCSFTWSDTGLRFKSNVGRGGKVENIFIDGIYMKDIDSEAVIFDLKYEDAAAVKNVDYTRPESRVPDFNTISIKNVVCDGARSAFLVDGSNVPMVSNITVDSVVFKTDKGISTMLARNLTFKNCTFDFKEKTAVNLAQTSDVKFQNCFFVQGKGAAVRLSGDNTKNISVENSNISRQQIAVESGVDANTVVVK